MYKQTALEKQRGNFNGRPLVCINVQQTDPSSGAGMRSAKKEHEQGPCQSPFSVSSSKIQIPPCGVTSHSKHQRQMQREMWQSLLYVSGDLR